MNALEQIDEQLKYIIPSLPDDMDLDAVAFTGRYRIVGEYDTFWDASPDQSGKLYMSDWVVNPTWRDLLIHADQSVPITHDYHHVYFEGARTKFSTHVTASVDLSENKYIKLSLGS